MPVLLTERKAPFLGFPFHKPCTAFLAPDCAISLGIGGKQNMELAFSMLILNEDD